MTPMAGRQHTGATRPVHRGQRADSVAGALTLLALLLLLSGCSVSWGSDSGGGDDPSEEDRNIALAADLEESFREMPGVLDVTLTYQDNITTPASMAVEVVVAADADANAVIDEITRDIWLSDIAPMKRFNVYGTWQTEPLQSLGLRYGHLSDAEIADLEERYGPRPD